MRFQKQIIDEFVSWIDLKDVQEYVMQLEKATIKNLVFGSLLIPNKINKINSFDFMQNLKGGEKNV